MHSLILSGKLVNRAGEDFTISDQEDKQQLKRGVRKHNCRLHVEKRGRQKQLLESIISVCVASVWKGQSVRRAWHLGRLVHIFQPCVAFPPQN